MKEIDYKNLRTITIFDICDDHAILKKITPCYPKYETKEDYVALYKESPVQQAFDLIDYADITKNRKLRDAISAEWNTELTHFFNEKI